MKQQVMAFFIATLFIFSLGFANASDTMWIGGQETTTEYIQVKFNPKEISKKVVDSLIKKEIPEFVDMESKYEVRYENMNFWQFPVDIIVTEATNRFTFDDKEMVIKKDELLEEKSSKNNWNIELCWRIMPIFFLILFIIQKKGVDYWSIGLGILFSATSSIYLTHKLTWDGAYMNNYMLSAILLIITAWTIRFFLPSPKEEEVITLSKLRALRKKEGLDEIIVQ